MSGYVGQEKGRCLQTISSPKGFSEKLKRTSQKLDHGYLRKMCWHQCIPKPAQIMTVFMQQRVLAHTQKSHSASLSSSQYSLKFQFHECPG